jgi:hypothetical protein
VPTYGHLVKIIDYGDVGYLSYKTQKVFLSVPDGTYQEGIRKNIASFYTYGVLKFAQNVNGILPEIQDFYNEWKKEVDVLYRNFLSGAFPIARFTQFVTSKLIEKLQENIPMKIPKRVNKVLETSLI